MTEWVIEGLSCRRWFFVGVFEKKLVWVRGKERFAIVFVRIHLPVLASPPTMAPPWIN